MTKFRLGFMGLGIATLFAHSAAAQNLDLMRPDWSLLFEPDSLLHAQVATVRPELSGTASAPIPGESGNVAPSITARQFVIKTQIGAGTHLALYATNPWGAYIDYDIGTTFPARGTQLDVSAFRLTAVLRQELGNGFSAIGGLTYETLEGDASQQVQGYQAELESDGAKGFLFGAAYEYPETGTRIMLTYESSIEHDVQSVEQLGFLSMTSSFKLTYPEAITLDATTGVGANTVIFGSVRWADWSSFSIAPPLISAGSPLLEFDEDSIDYRIGIGHRFSERWSGAAIFGAAPGDGDSLLTPFDGQRSATLAVKYHAPEWSLSGAVQYVRLGDTVRSTAPLSDNIQFQDNHAVAVSIGLTRRF